MMRPARAEAAVLLAVAVLLLALDSALAFVPLRPAAAPSSSPLWRRQQQQPRPTASAADAFSLDDSGWKDADSSYVPIKQPQLKRGAFRLPRLTEIVSAYFPPASRLHKLKNAILRRRPVYGSLYHEDYVDACRSLGVPQDIEEGALAKKVEQLMLKYEKDRRKKIMIDWAHDKILEHRLFLQLDGEAVRPRGVDMRRVDERCLEVSQKDALDLMSQLDLSPADLSQGRAASNPLARLLFNNPLAKALQLRRLLGMVGYVQEAFRDSFEGPSVRRLVWPGSVALILAFWFGNALESLPLKYLIVVMAHSGPIYNRGEASLANRKERRPIKWKKIGLAIAFMAISSGASYALGKAWLALKYPSLDLPEPAFLFLLTNLATYVMSSFFFIRESTLAGADRRGPPGRRPA